MITEAAARLIVEREINMSRRDEDRWMVYPELSITRDWGWVMFYGSEENYYVGDKEAVLDPESQPAYLINRVTSELAQAGKSWPIKKYIDDDEMQLRSIQN